MATYYGSNGNDTADMTFYNYSHDTVWLYDGNDTAYGGYGNDTLIGGRGQDWLYGGDHNDFLYGQDDNDVLSGGGGNDELHGEAGDDYLSGGSGNDTLKGSYGNDFLRDDEGGNDYLSGGFGNDTIYSGIGSDTIYGSTGVDQLFGSKVYAGGDRFEFQTQDTGSIFSNEADTIADFSDTDQIYLKGSYSYAGASALPANGQYSIWWHSDITSWIVRYNNASDAGYHDIIVKGGDPHGDISFF